MSVIVPEVARCRVPAEMRMHARGAMVIVVVVVQVGVDERRPQRPKLQGDYRRDRDERTEHTGIVIPAKAEDFLKSSSEA